MRLAAKRKTLRMPRKKRRSKLSAGTKKRRRRATTRTVRFHAYPVYSEEAVAEQHRVEERRARLKAATGNDEEDEGEASDDSFM